MGNQSSLLQTALQNPKNDQICRAAFDALDKDHARILHSEELDDFRTQLALAVRLQAGDEHGSLAKLDALIESSGNVIEYTLFRDFLFQLKEFESWVIDAGEWGHLQKDVLTLLLQRLDIQDLAQCCAVNRWWLHVASKDNIWIEKSHTTRAIYCHNLNTSVKLMARAFYSYVYEEEITKFRTANRNEYKGEVVLDARSSGPRGFTITAHLKVRHRLDGFSTSISEKIHCSWRGTPARGYVRIHFESSKLSFRQGLNYVVVVPSYTDLDVHVENREPMKTCYDAIFSHRLLGQYDDFESHF